MRNSAQWAVKPFVHLEFNSTQCVERYFGTFQTWAVFSNKKYILKSEYFISSCPSIFFHPWNLKYRVWKLYSCALHTSFCHAHFNGLPLVTMDTSVGNWNEKQNKGQIMSAACPTNEARIVGHLSKQLLRCISYLASEMAAKATSTGPHSWLDTVE